MEHDTPSSGFTVDASSPPARLGVALTRPFVPTRTAFRDRTTVTPFAAVVVVDIARTTATTITVVVHRAREIRSIASIRSPTPRIAPSTMDDLARPFVRSFVRSRARVDPIDSMHHPIDRRASSSSSSCVVVVDDVDGGAHPSNLRIRARVANGTTDGTKKSTL